MTGTILVTGATGFLGARVVSALGRRTVRVRTLSRRVATGESDARTGDVTDAASLEGLCDDIDTVVHCAGFAHAHEDGTRKFEARHFAVNHEGTRSLLEVACKAAVRRFVLLSSVKAMAPPGDEQVNEDLPGEPDSAYGRSKRAAEEAAFAAGRTHGMQIVVLRLAMVYGAGDHGNLARMVHGIRSGWFPPLPDTGNHRSLVHADDAVDAILLATTHRAASGRTYIVASEEAPSGARLYDAIRQALSMPPTTWRVPAALLRTAGVAGQCFGRVTGTTLPLTSESIERLLDSAWYSPARIRRDLGWQTRVALAQGLRDYIDVDSANPSRSEQMSDH